MTIRITHFSDVLCIWAYISQVRVAELRENFGRDVAFDYRYFSVFGDTRTKMAAQWKKRGGMDGYASHVRDVASEFEHVTIHPRLWSRGAPASSMPAHLMLTAARVTPAHDGEVLLALDHEIRRSFFEDAVDISQTPTLLAICERCGADVAGIEHALRTGAAHAALSTDMKQALELGIRASPTMTFNEGRQTLTGNVGYRVIEANVRELLRNPQDQRSWC